MDDRLTSNLEKNKRLLRAVLSLSNLFNTPIVKLS